jgi:carbonic anhydrase
MKFCTSVNCMDGRVQLPVIEYLKQRFEDGHVDMITEAGPNMILASESPPDLFESIMNRIAISVERHHSSAIAVVGHFDCAGNPGGREVQEAHTRRAIQIILSRFKKAEVIGLWVDENWDVAELS